METTHCINLALKWHANSPDLDSIENMRKVVKDLIQNQTLPRNKKELVKTIQWAWKDMSQETIDVLVANMCARMKAIIKAHGGSTRW